MEPKFVWRCRQDAAAKGMAEAAVALAGAVDVTIAGATTAEDPAVVVVVELISGAEGLDSLINSFSYNNYFLLFFFF